MTPSPTSVYTVVERPSAGLALVLSMEHGRQLFAAARSRKNRECVGCGCAIHGGDMAYRPVGNSMNRYVRLCMKCVEG